MSKHTCGQALVLPRQCLVCPAGDDDFAICQNARVDKCLCCQADVQCILQLLMTLFYHAVDVYKVSLSHLLRCVRGTNLLNLCLLNDVLKLHKKEMVYLIQYAKNNQTYL